MVRQTARRPACPLFWPSQAAEGGQLPPPACRALLGAAPQMTARGQQRGRAPGSEGQGASEEFMVSSHTPHPTKGTPWRNRLLSEFLQQLTPRQRFECGELTGELSPGNEMEKRSPIQGASPSKRLPLWTGGLLLSGDFGDSAERAPASGSASGERGWGTWTATPVRQRLRAAPGDTEFPVSPGLACKQAGRAPRVRTSPAANGRGDAGSRTRARGPGPGRPGRAQGSTEAKSGRSARSTQCSPQKSAEKAAVSKSPGWCGSHVLPHGSVPSVPTFVPLPR